MLHHPEYLAALERRAHPAARQFVMMIALGAAGLPEAGARPLGLRDRCCGDAAGQGRARRHPRRPAGRIRNTKKLLRTAALIMSVLLLGSIIRDHAAHSAGGVPGRAARRTGRALAYLAHEHLGECSARSTTSAPSRSSGSPVRRPWPVFSTWCRATCRATAWRPEWTRATRPLVAALHRYHVPHHYDLQC